MSNSWYQIQQNLLFRWWFKTFWKFDVYFNSGAVNYLWVQSKRYVKKLKYNKWKKYYIILIILFFSFTQESKAKENKILLKINNQIVTSVDILDEINYLGTINEEYKKLDKENAIKIAKKSLIREKIKEIELWKYIKR